MMTRRHLITHAPLTIATLAIGSSFVSGCATAFATTAEPFLATLSDSMAAGLGMSMANWLGTGAVDAAPKAWDALVQDLGSQPAKAVYGVAPVIVDTSALKTVIAGYVDNNGLKVSSVHDNVHNLIVVPSVLSLGISILSYSRLQKEFPSAAPNNPSFIDRRNSLRHELAINVFDGSNNGILDHSIFDAIAADGKNIQVEWSPTTDTTVQSRLVVRRGYRMSGVAPIWDEEYQKSFPSYELWVRSKDGHRFILDDTKK